MPLALHDVEEAREFIYATSRSILNIDLEINSV